VSKPEIRSNEISIEIDRYVPKSSEKKERAILRNINLNIKRGENLGILGPSGCGKTTLLKIIAGLKTIEDCDTANTYFSINPDKEHRAAAQKREAFIFQESLLTCWQNGLNNVLLPIKISNKSKLDSKRKEAVKLFKETGLDVNEIYMQYPKTLSGGQARRLSFVQALINDPDILFLDEPFTGQDFVNKNRLINLLLRHDKTRDITIIFATHDIDDAIAISDRIIIMGPEGPSEDASSVIKAEKAVHRNADGTVRNHKDVKEGILAIDWFSLCRAKA
jgi:ABC-type nitrate/sulfonate/bicarbonate transport system ATPase subunit